MLPDSAPIMSHIAQQRHEFMKYHGPLMPTHVRLPMGQYQELKAYLFKTSYVMDADFFNKPLQVMGMHVRIGVPFGVYYDMEGQ